MYKLVHKLIDYPNAPIQHQLPVYSSRNQNSLSLELHHCHTTTFLNSFFPKTSKYWNSLPKIKYDELIERTTDIEIKLDRLEENRGLKQKKF